MHNKLETEETLIATMLNKRCVTDNDGERVEETGPTPKIGGHGKTQKVSISSYEEAEIPSKQGFRNAKLAAEYTDTLETVIASRKRGKQAKHTNSKIQRTKRQTFAKRWSFEFWCISTPRLQSKR